ncbi:type VII secretion protein EccCb [Streptomyces turgidiscabies]|uniref:FtsK/SpoIIIE family protein n=1 Tax=Streptomyces turgidiscabies (strain Car8) TaxID=698760 RepID=L7EVD4_STRT8|nr:MULTISPECIES: type VII secretion protein EccCb [Streptomyces]ELP62636.1 FtsK/SpoIIIE family protein [Streptomyces turgidiscabies Car8]MDX3494951.1 type VII secretion protein EccCb [Streptomyces turgidiscabies]GAQ70824.1 ESX-1 secretion system protein EccCb1 [Streptomyces turgidiscabies]
MAGRRIALLVATDGYQDPGLSRLRRPARGATELKVLLEDRSIGRFEPVLELLNRPKDEIESAIEEVLSNRDPDDLVLLYFACHGIRNDADRLFFATLGTRLQRPHTTAVPAALLHQLLDECEARTKIVLLDCCYSGLFHRGSPMSPAPVDVEKALAGRGTFVITASTALEYAYEGDHLSVDNSLSAPRFTAAVIEGLRSGLADQNRDGVITPEELYTFVHDTVVNQAGPEQTPTKSGQCEGNVALAYAPWIDASAGPAARAALADELTLGSLLPPPVETVDRGFVCDAWQGASRLLVPVGRLENSTGGDPMCVDFAGRDGNAAVVGKLGSGKTTLLRSMIMSLALTHTPHEAEFYLLEGAVNRLGVLRSLPHVRTFAAPHEHSAVEEALTAVRAVISTRRTLFRDLDIDSIEAFRALRMTGRIEEGAASDVFLVVDGWLDFTWEHPDFAETVHRLANTGLNYGVHLVVTARRWSDFTTDLRGLLGTRLELALDDPEESFFDPSLASGISVGWALSRRRRFRVAVPRFDGGAGPAAARESLAGTAESIRAGWAALQTPESTEAPAKPSVDQQEPPLTGLLGVENTASPNLAALRARPAPEDRLRVPIGLGEDGSPVFLDLKESAHGGMGPHGLCVGATGSGKSELLRSIVLGLAVRHSAEEVAFLLADFKGGATFAALADLPHISGIVNGLADDPLLVGRMGETISGELARRQQLLRAAGLASVHDYQKARASRDDLEPLPTLVLVIDEFSELLSAHPDFIDRLVQVGRVGRALGVHMLLASQRLEEGRLVGLHSHLSYRIGLRTFSLAESRAVLGHPDAYDLPSDPGAGFLKADTTDVLIRFKASYVSASVPNADPADGYASLVDMAVEHLRAADPAARRIWLPPLDESPTLDQVLPAKVALTSRHGLRSPGSELLRAPFALADEPFHQRRTVISLDASGTEGNALVVGGPQSGKSTLLATLITSFALTHTAAEVQFYCLAFGGGGLAALAGLPHVGGVFSRLDPDQVRRTVADFSRVLGEREEFFRAHGIDSIRTFRRRRAEGEWPDQPLAADIFLVIDGWATLRRDFEALEPVVTEIATHGLAHGVHLMVTVSRSTELRLTQRDLLFSRFELRLGDPTESEIDRRQAQYVPLGAPGHGLARDKLHFVTALPRMGAEAAGELTGETTDSLVAAVHAHWQGPTAPPVRTLPALVPLDGLPGPDDSPGRAMAVGIDDASLAPVFLDFSNDPFFLVYGESESGKSSFLRLLVRQLRARVSPEEAQLLVVDYRRSLLGEVPQEYLLSYCPSGPPVAEVVGQLAEVLQARMPGPDVTAEQLRDRSWYRGKDVYLLVDDYDLVATSSGNPLAPLIEYLPFARDLGLRVVLTRSSGGASRAQYEPFVTRLKELGAQGLMLSGDPAEGFLLGSVKPTRLPPGRGTLVTRRGTHGVQLAYPPPTFE